MNCEMHSLTEFSDIKKYFSPDRMGDSASARKTFLSLTFLQITNPFLLRNFFDDHHDHLTNSIEFITL